MPKQNKKKDNRKRDFDILFEEIKKQNREYAQTNESHNTKIGIYLGFIF